MWDLNPTDRELFTRELDDFVPPRVFDAHAHLYDSAHLPVDRRPAGDAVCGAESYLHRVGAMLPGRELSGLFFPFPAVGVPLEAANRFLAEEVKRLDGSRGLMLVTPRTSLDEIRRGVEEDGFVGLKCYHVYSDHRPTFDSEVEDFLPESQVQLAGELGLVVMLHLVCSRALAEKSNRDWIRATCRKYPRMRLILAHAARGFNPHHTIHGIDDLRGLENVWFDTSAVTECGAFEAILSVFGHRRLLYGSDFPVSHLRGRCVAICDTFVWLTPEDLPREVEYAMLSPALVGLESLRVLKLAARHTRLSDRQVEDVFYHNALALWNDG